ncbi:MAG: 2-oxoglutarate dehydrogenase E1 component [Gemmataceae bacterium]|nr:2-oxoglutarate dehydrogenase E1 component [Gemmataceae bacterium]MCI0740691.1 2-oxoglutarate dehydrogenase E1 component [Gemmataceae bacterium]
MHGHFAGRWNLLAIEEAYKRWKQDPASVEESWRVFFEGFELGLAQQPAVLPSPEARQAGIIRLIDAYRGLGHLLAKLDPLSEPPKSVALLDISEFGFTEHDLDRTFDTSHFLGLERGTLRQLLAALRETYCRTIGVEYMHIQDNHIRRWLEERIEPRRLQPEYGRRQKLRVLMDLHYAELFEKFLHTRYLGQKRFSLEGAETLIPILDFLVEKGADSGIREIVLGMAHRGRLNVLANILGKPYAEIFSEFQENYLPNSMAGDGDVKYHLGFSGDRVSARGNRVHLSLTPNPSHLEAVNPVVEGRVRAKQHLFGDQERSRCLPLLIHGDAAVAGQGLVAETLNLSQLQGYKTGGTIHVVINNQIGFTTAPADARSTRYCTDVAKMIEVPIFHVNGEDPEAAVFAIQLAVEFRQTFHKDVFLDMYCYRRWGHNEGDEPSFTQPILYAKILERPSLSEVYTEQLIIRGDLTVEETQAIVQGFQERLEKSQEEIKQAPQAVGMRGYQGQWKSLSAQYSWSPVETGVSQETLDLLTEAITKLPDGFTPHPKVARLLESRRREQRERKPVDWAFAEALAFGALLAEKTHVRLSGQDTRRGTFSQRHAVLYDNKTGQPYTPLAHIRPDQAVFSTYDSLLSEAAVLGFEFGYSLDCPEALVVWEAQFGDFVNGAQVIIDQFLVCSNSKWQRDSGLVLLLPHGYEGQGPEHSSARLERFLQLCGEDNIQVCYPTTPAQYFHLLRRQVRRSFRKPLVVMTPKSLLRHRLAASPWEDFTQGNFREVLDDAKAESSKVKRLVLCSGKIYYDLLEQRAKDQAAVALVRVEQFYPFPSDALQRLLKRYAKAREVVWVQEESLNMGGWTFMESRLRAMGAKVKYIGRDTSASPATGSRQVHLREQKEIVEAAITGLAPHLVRAAPSTHLRRYPKWEDEGIEAEVEEQINKLSG